MDQNDIDALIAERIAIFREMSPERFAYEPEPVIVTTLSAFSYAAAALNQVIAQLVAVAIQAGHEEKEAMTLAIGAVGGSAVAYRLNNEEKIRPELCEEYVDLFSRYAGRLAEESKAKAAEATDNIIHGLFGKEPGKPDVH